MNLICTQCFDDLKEKAPRDISFIHNDKRCTREYRATISHVCPTCGTTITKTAHWHVEDQAALYDDFTAMGLWYS